MVPATVPVLFFLATAENYVIPFKGDCHISYNKIIAVLKKSMHHRGLFVENGAIVLSQAMVRVADYDY